MRDVDAIDRSVTLPRQAAGRFRRRIWLGLLFGLFCLLFAHVVYSAAYYAWNWDFGGSTEVSDNFDAGNLETWRRNGDVQLCCPHSAVFVNSERKPGSLALRFRLQTDDTDVKGSRRAELRLKAAPFGQDRWYFASLRVPPDWVGSPEPTTVLQWHAVDDKILGEISRSPPLRLLIQDREWAIVSRWDARPITGLPLLRDPVLGEEKVLWKGPLDIGLTTDWLFRVRWSHVSDGIVAVWKNGTQIVCREGANTYNDLIGPYLKVGIYVPIWKAATDRKTTSRELIVERVRQSAYPLDPQDRSDARAPADTISVRKCDGGP
jgi:hypothetical protein